MDLLKMIIVDDELFILNSLETLIDWSSVGVEVVGVADNGRVAIDLALSLKPDIILSDISMPHLSGLEMLEVIRREQLHIEVIFISAHSRFEYAKEAIRYGAFEYILKPIEEANLLETVGRCVKKIHDSREKSRHMADAAYEWMAQLDGGTSVYYDSIADKLPFYYGNLSDAQNSIAVLVKSMAMDGIQDALLDFFRLIARDSSILDPVVVRLHCIDLVVHVLEELNVYRIHEYMDSHKTLDIKKSIASCTTLDSTFDVTQGFLVEFCKCLKEVPEYSNRHLISSVLDYIKENFHKNITLSQVARQIYITPTYLSKIFSAEVHKTFSQYLLSCRIDRAKHLLRNTHSKVYEIALQVGYSDTAHFSKLFKQYTGQTPNQYRNRG